MRRTPTPRELQALQDLPPLPRGEYLRALHASGVRYRDIAVAFQRRESTIADWAAVGRYPVIGQRVPDGFADRLRQLRVERSNAKLNALLAAAIDRGWTLVALGEALGISPQAVWSRAQKADGTGGQRVPRPAS